MNTTISNTTTDVGNMPAHTRDIAGIAGIARDLGLKQTQAWVVDETVHVKSSGAERVRRHREKVEQQGFKQLSAIFPAELHPWVKELAARTRAGNSLKTAIAELMPASIQPDQNRILTHTEAALMLLNALPTWRRWLLRWLLRWLFRGLVPHDWPSERN